MDWLELLRGLETVVAPPECVACRRALAARPGADWRGALCSGCERELELDQASDGPGRLGATASVTALVRYRGTGRAVLRQLKYYGREDLGPRLGRDLGARFRARHPARAACPGRVVVPVPLHPWRRWRRGFNQAEAIATGVAERLGCPVVRALARRRRTEPLFAVAHADRPAAVADAFRVRLPAAVRGRPVALVDDIRTTGATAEAAAGALLAAGCLRVDVLVVAR